jgi:type III restriction enzyme
VVGRGLRRTAYELNPETGLFDPEYVNIFGVPFTFLPHESEDGAIPAPPKPKTAIEPDPSKSFFEISWPNVVRIDHVYRPQLSLNSDEIKPLVLNASETARIVEIAPILAGKPDTSKVQQIDLERLAQEFRTQKIVFEAARDVFDQMRTNWKGSKEALLAQVVRLVEQFIRSDKIEIVPSLFESDQLRRRLIITLNMTKVVQHIWEAIRFENTEKLALVFDQDRPIRSTGDMATWYTGKPCGRAAHSHINFCVYDSTWEAGEAFELDNNSDVEAWVKNDHLGFEILYLYQGVIRKYRPDFIVRLKGGNYLVLEVKGEDTDRDRTKRNFLAEWVTAVNEHGGFGPWSWDVSKTPGDVKDIIARHAKKEAASIAASGS